MTTAEFEALVARVKEANAAVLDNLGLRVKFVPIPRYARACKRLLWIPRWLRWLVPGRKREYEAAWKDQQAAFLADVLDRIDKGE